ncbi:MAG: hypothetical protein DMF61_13460 [Blastocatellia bacterium AA13]|nr:MAG: hypothetical protein DMF61_13460 [Blastocatellia bacterium AA13]
MKIRLYCDEDAMDGDLVHALRIRGIDVTSALEQGMVRRPDRDHLELATSQGRVLYSFNIGDFQQLHSEYLAQGKPHSGIILGQQQRYGLGEQMRRLLNIVGRVSNERQPPILKCLVNSR